MNHYIDIKVLPDPEFCESMLMNALFAKLHRALVTLKSNNIGVSFPKAGKTPGRVLRLHSEKRSLEQLMEQAWLKGLRDYTDCQGVNPIPETDQFVLVKRVQPKMTAARLRRAVSRNSMTEEEAEALLESRTDLKKPFFRLQSQSTSQNFSLFIEQGKPMSESKAGSFNAYGLSQTATVPWF